MNAKIRKISSRKDEVPKETVLDVVDISKHFDLNGSSRHVLNRVSFNAGKNEMICIIGRSGCGKTTLLNILAGFLKPGSGTISVNGKPVKGPGPDRCFVFQEDTLFPWLTVQENIAFGLKGFFKDKKYILQEVERYLDLMGLQNYSNYLPREISGGMKQRVALARVLILKPKVLLMDEPFASLDYCTRREMQNLLVSLWKELSQTIIFVTHDVDEAITLADKILVLDAVSGCVRDNIAISLPRPRKAEQADYVFFRKRLHEYLCY